MLDETKKEYFDPKNKKHLKLFSRYFFENKWGNPCPFILEYPYYSIPEMCIDKILKHTLLKYK